MEPELKSYLEKFKQQLDAISTKSESLWKSFFRGVLSGIGSIFGVAVALALIGWFLNAVGVIPAFREQARSWQQSLEEIRRVR